MDELRVTIASNIIDLRTKAGMTQLELAEKLNYSDKSVSKWERAEATPDVFVLKNIGEIFDCVIICLHHMTAGPLHRQNVLYPNISPIRSLLLLLSVSGRLHYFSSSSFG